MLAIVAVSVVAMCACGAFVMDVGAWYRAQRATQSAADAAALAGAQKLPLDATSAQALATEYADKNGGGLTEKTLSSNSFANDTISTKVERTSPAFLARVLGITSVDMSATASARAWNIGAAKYAAPFGVIRHGADAEQLRRPLLRAGLSDGARAQQGRPRLLQDH